MNWSPIVLLTVVGLVFIAVDFYIPNFVLGSIGAVLMLFATVLCYNATGSLNEAIVVFFVEVALGIGKAQLERFENLLRIARQLFVLRIRLFR